MFKGHPKGLFVAFFANMGGGSFEGQPFRWLARKSETYTPIVGYNQTSVTTQQPIYGQTQTISGLRLVDARASYGISLQTFALGFPVHFDYAWRTLFNKQWEDALFAAPCSYSGEVYCGGSSNFRKPKFSVWIGYDF